MSDVILTNRLTGNTFINSAVLHVCCPLGSSVTISKNSIIKTLESTMSHQNENDPTMSDYYFLISSENYGDWTILGEKGTETFTSIITISTNRQYDVTMYYRFWLYNNGISNVGWRNYGGSTFTLETSYITAAGNAMGTTGKINFSNYKYLIIDYMPINVGTAGYGYKWGVTITNTAAQSNFYSATSGATPSGALQNVQYTVGSANCTNNQRTVLKITLNTAARENGNHYLGFGCYSGTYRIYKVYLTNEE